MLNWILLDSAFCDGSAISAIDFEFQFYRLSMLYWNFLFLYIWFIENYGYEQTENYSNSFIHWIKLIYYKCILFFMITFHILGQFNCCKDPLSFTQSVLLDWKRFTRTYNTGSDKSMVSSLLTAHLLDLFWYFRSFEICQLQFCIWMQN